MLVSRSDNGAPFFAIDSVSIVIENGIDKLRVSKEEHLVADSITLLTLQICESSQFEDDVSESEFFVSDSDVNIGYEQWNVGFSLYPQGINYRVSFTDGYITSEWIAVENPYFFPAVPPAEAPVWRPINHRKGASKKPRYPRI